MTLPDLPQAFTMQARACADLDSPFMERLMSLLATRLRPGTPVADAMFGWTGDPSFRGHSLPLRLAGALHALKLRGMALSDVYPPHDVPDEALWSAIDGAMRDHAGLILDWLDRAPQTNEVRRAAAVLPVLSELNARLGLPVHLMELGASGGLNLAMDRFAVEAGGRVLGDPGSPVRLSPRWSGPDPLGDAPQVLSRAGVDLAPVDAATEEGRLRLLAYLWPDQPDRIARTDAAIDIARRHPAKIDRADAGAWLDATQPEAGEALTVIYHTVAWQYFPPATQARALNAMAARARSGLGGARIARIGMEGDGGRGAAVTLTIWPGPETHLVARADFHGRWIEWKGLPDAL